MNRGSTLGQGMLITLFLIGCLLRFHVSLGEARNILTLYTLHVLYRHLYLKDAPV